MYTCNCICISLYLIFSLANQSVCFYTELYSKIKYHSLSHISEQCDSRWVTANLQGLKDDLNEHLFGQDLAIKVILGALSGHLNNKNRKKPLVLNFQGWTGGGKTFVAQLIGKHWFKNAGKSEFFKSLEVSKFMLSEKAYEHQRFLQGELESTVKKCSKSVFVFDEIDKYPPKVLDGISPYLDYKQQVNGLDFREAIFIFITNRDDELITNIVLEKFKQGISRDELVVSDFENHLKKPPPNNADHESFFESDLIKHHLIDHVVPFLPLERNHIMSCIKTEMMFHQDEFVDFETISREIIDELVFGPEENKTFCVSGCKYISSKVNLYIYMEKEKKRRRTEL